MRLLKLIAKKKIANYDKWFESIAMELFYHTQFKIKQHEYEFIEVEFYVNCTDHPDVFSHSSDDQKQNGTFCFHKMGKSFKEGNYKGLDIAIGNQDRHGGILIRGLRNCKNGEVIDGPSNVVSEILRYYKTSKVRELDAQIDHALDGKDLTIVETKTDAVTLKTNQLKTPRVGLTLKRPAPEKTHFLVKDYRYLKYPELTKKGRHWIIASALLKSHLLKLPPSIMIKYETILNAGKKLEHHRQIKLDHESTLNDFIKLYGHFTKNDL